MPETSATVMQSASVTQVVSGASFPREVKVSGAPVALTVVKIVVVTYTVDQTLPAVAVGPLTEVPTTGGGLPGGDIWGNRELGGGDS